MTEQQTEVREGKRVRATLIAGAIAVAVVLGGLGVAGAQTTTTSEKKQSEDSSERRADKAGADHGGALHGERVTRAPGGGYQTVGHQVGQVTKVSASSITVRSEDDYSRTYAVGDDTMVAAGNNGIADVKEGDVVHVTAIVRGERAAAVSIRDVTQIRRIQGKYGPGGDQKQGQRRRGPGGPGDGPR
jgi:hypothetical protein